MLLPLVSCDEQFSCHACTKQRGSINYIVIPAGNLTQIYAQVTYDIIRRRLQMENPHKQWLAVDMTRHLLSACHERLRPYRTELLYHVARVAIKPNKKGPITAQHKARKAATDYLHQCGEEGQNALRMARMQLGNFQQSGGMPIGPLGPYGPDGHPMNPTGAYSTVPQPCVLSYAHLPLDPPLCHLADLAAVDLVSMFCGL